MKYDIKKILPFSSIIKKSSGRFGDYVFYMRYGHICAIVCMKERLKECQVTCTPERPTTTMRRRERVLRTGGRSTNVMNSFTLSNLTGYSTRRD